VRCDSCKFCPNCQLVRIYIGSPERCGLRLRNWTHISCCAKKASIQRRTSIPALPVVRPAEQSPALTLECQGGFPSLRDNKGLRPLRRFAAIPAHLRAENDFANHFPPTSLKKSISNPDRLPQDRRSFRIFMEEIYGSF
jgi:hypothetical protein